MENSKRVGIWIRVSTEQQVKDESPEHHEQRARYYTEAKGWQVMEVYKLEAVSGKAVINHPEARRMLADIKSKHITGLVFSKLARLARSTKELLEFAEIFRKEGADLVSLAENIDTSSPAGRLFFTIISAMAEWEREEIAARVAASVPIRAKLGKSIGGQASFGYQWVDNRFVIDEKEAPVRKLMYELFLKHQRKLATAKELNAMGYRTRHGHTYTATAVGRLLRDSTAKGERRAFHTKHGSSDKNWSRRPQEDWIIMPCPAIITPELWHEVNSILDSQEVKPKNVGRKAVYLLSGFVVCTCGKRMYVYHTSKIYACSKCHTRISVIDMDEIYQQYLKEYLDSINLADYKTRGDSDLQECKALLEVSVVERNKIAKRINELISLRLDGGLTKERYMEQYAPLEERLQQLDNHLPRLEAEIDVRTMQLLSGDVVITEAKTLLHEWEQMEFSQKRGIVETITVQIEVGREEINITLAYAPPNRNAENSSHHSREKSYSSYITVVRVCPAYSLIKFKGISPYGRNDRSVC
jgi:site-specific DNA recombinase